MKSKVTEPIIDTSLPVSVLSLQMRSKFAWLNLFEIIHCVRQWIAVIIVNIPKTAFKNAQQLV